MNNGLIGLNMLSDILPGPNDDGGWVWLFVFGLAIAGVCLLLYFFG